MEKSIGLGRFLQWEVFHQQLDLGGGVYGDGESRIETTAQRHDRERGSDSLVSLRQVGRGGVEWCHGLSIAGALRETMA